MSRVVRTEPKEETLMDGYVAEIGRRDSAMRIALMRRFADLVHAVTPVERVATYGLTWMGGNGYSIVLREPACSFKLPEMTPERGAAAIAAALAKFGAKLHKAAADRAVLRTTVHDAALIGEIVAGRRFRAEAEAIANPPHVTITADGVKFETGMGMKAVAGGRTILWWKDGRIRAHYRDDQGIECIGGALILTGRKRMPETLVAAMKGRRLDQVVDFPPLRRQDVTVVGAAQRDTAKGTVLRIRIRSAEIGMADAAKVVDRARALRQMGKA